MALAPYTALAPEGGAGGSGAHCAAGTPLPPDEGVVLK